MMEYHEEESTGTGLFNRQLMRILFGYVLHYKKQLFFSLFCVVVITASTLTIPYLAKIIFDRYIVKQGFCVDEEKLTPKGNPDLRKRLGKALRLSDNRYFLFQSQLSFFSKSQIQGFIKAGIFSGEKYTLVESPRPGSVALAHKLDAAVARGTVLNYSGSLYLFRPSALKEFTNKELLRLRSGDARNIARYVLFMLIVFAVQFVASYLQIVSLMRLSQHSMRDLRRDLFGHVLSLEVSYFDKNPIGRLVNRVSNDIEVLNDMFSSVLITLFQDILILTGITAIMFFANVYLACAVAVTCPFLFTVTVIFRVRVRDAYRVIRTRIADLNAFLNENISGIRIVQIFVQEAKQLAKFVRINNAVYNANIRQLYIYAVFRPIIDFFRWLSIATVIYLGSRLILDDMVSYGMVLMFIAYIGSFFEPIGDLSEKFDIMQSATAAGEKILAVFNAPVKKELPDPVACERLEQALKTTGMFDGKRLSGGIEFDNVWFAYNPDEWILRGISFSVKPHETLAIVGETGSGKTTIISLLSGFYAIQKGTITIDGVNTRDIPFEILRKNIATVMQDVFLFSRSLRDNVILNNEYDEERFRTVTQITHINKFIRNLAQGENEQVMERGATFSAGERQLLAFARALYADPSVLVLDEATSNIDTETERLIRDAIAHLIQGRTSIIIAHRLSTVRNASRILVLEKGRIVEEGDHASLLARQGMYYDLYKMQFADI
jgi:ATP-binding cassette subfamily B protein/subfamily B ATP-binding cassette protein MsbA